MTRPVFISVGGSEDAAYATEIQKQLGDSIAYHYQRTGEENVLFRSEIEKEIVGCRIFVAIWSETYLKSEYACLELAKFKKHAEGSSEQSKYLMIVPRKEGVPDIQTTKWKNPINNLEEYALGHWRLNRAVMANAESQRVTELIKKRLGEMDILTDVLITRGWLLDHFKSALFIPNDYKIREVLFVSGLEGSGRRTSLKQYMSSSWPHLVMMQMMLDTVDQPDDFLHHAMATTSYTAQNRADIFAKIQNGESNFIKEIRKIFHSGRNLQCYYVITVDRFIGVDADRIPTWFSELFKPFHTGPRPLIFIVTSNPVSSALLEHYPLASAINIPGLEENQTEELIAQLIQKETNPNRWTAEKRKTVASICSGSPSLCKSVMLALRSELNLDFLESIAKRSEEKFSEGLSSIINHWIARYNDKPTDLAMLRIIEKLGVTSKEALDEILEPVVKNHGESNLYDLRNQGLVEQMGDGLYRIPPLIQRRLGSTLWTKKMLVENIDVLLEEFAKKAAIPHSEFGAIYAKNIVQVALKYKSPIAKDYEVYISITSLFKIGIDKYRNKSYVDAHNIFSRVLKMMDVNDKHIDTRIQMEIYRYSGMAACRLHDFQTVKIIRNLLNEKFSNPKRKQIASAIAYFLEGFSFRIESKYDFAIKKYKDALKLIEADIQFHVQNSSLYAELALSNLRSNNPNYEEAKHYAEKAYKTSDVVQTLSTYIHALIRYAFDSGKFLTLNSNTDNIAEIESKLLILYDRCTENQQGHYDEQKTLFDKRLRNWNAQFVRN
ncbi:MAG: TIR domain-containing protein [Cytophagales bacterium]|nr:TIR domain-containing protein [Cytophagales bacterium]